MHTYLDFEKSIAELEGKIQELKALVERLVRELPERVSTAVVLGHEPTMSEVLHEVVSRWQFAGGPPDAFPTCTMAFIEFKKPWADLKPGHGRLVRFEIPRG